jgi:hypothetical protein
MRSLTPLEWFEPFGLTLERESAGAVSGDSVNVPPAVGSAATGGEAEEAGTGHAVLFAGIDPTAPDHDEELFVSGSRCVPRERWLPRQELHLCGRGDLNAKAMPGSHRHIVGRCIQVITSPGSLQASRGSLKGWTCPCGTLELSWRAELGTWGWDGGVPWSSLVWSSSRVIRKRFSLPSVIHQAIWCNFGSEGALLCLLHPGRRLTTYSPTGAPTPTTVASQLVSPLTASA